MAIMDLEIENERYLVMDRLGQGTHGSVFRIVKDNTEEQIALKIMQTKTQEIEVLKKLQSESGFPKIVTTFNENELQCVAMTLCGLTLKDLKKINGNSLGLNSILNIMYQCVDLIQKVHNKGYIHCDLKPENLMIGCKDDYKTVYLIDFSLSEKFTDENDEPLEEPAHSIFKGSISFCSIRVLKGGYPTLADDIESLLYSVMYLLKALPWLPSEDMEFEDSKAKKDYVINKKKKLEPKEIFLGYPSVFYKIYNEIRYLNYSESPDYDRIKEIIVESFTKNFPKKQFGVWRPITKYEEGKIPEYMISESFINRDIKEEQKFDSFFVDSFTNFKSFELNEKDDDEESKDSPTKVQKHDKKPEKFGLLRSIVKAGK